MANLFSRARDWLPAQLEAAGGETVTYTRAGVPVELTACVGRTVFASNAEGAARIEFGDADFEVRVAEFVRVGFDPPAPKMNDRVTRTIDGLPVTFEVMTPGTGEQAWRANVDRTVFRIHTKFVKVA